MKPCIRREKYDIYLVVDDRYLYPLLVTLFMLKKERNFINLFLVFCGDLLSEENRKVISSFSSFLEIDLTFKELQISLDGLEDRQANHLSKSAYLKTFILAKDFGSKKGLILDCDLLITSGWLSIFNLLESTNHNSFIYARRDRSAQATESSNKAMEVAGDRYFNSGVLLFDKKFAPANSNGQTITETIMQSKDLGFKWKDQDVMNYLYSHYCGDLPEEFNLFIPEDYHEKGFIWHFLGGERKPWTIGPSALVRLLRIKTKVFYGPFRLYRREEKALFNSLKLGNSNQSLQLNELLKDLENARNIANMQTKGISYYLLARLELWPLIGNLSGKLLRHRA